MPRNELEHMFKDTEGLSHALSSLTDRLWKKPPMVYHTVVPAVLQLLHGLGKKREMCTPFSTEIVFLATRTLTTEAFDTMKRQGEIMPRFSEMFQPRVRMESAAQAVHWLLKETVRLMLMFCEDKECPIITYDVALYVLTKLFTTSADARKAGLGESAMHKISAMIQCEKWVGARFREHARFGFMMLLHTYEDGTTTVFEKRHVEVLMHMVPAQASSENAAQTVLRGLVVMQENTDEAMRYIWTVGTVFAWINTLSMSTTSADVHSKLIRVLRKPMLDDGLRPHLVRMGVLHIVTRLATQEAANDLTVWRASEIMGVFAKCSTTGPLLAPLGVCECIRQILCNDNNLSNDTIREVMHSLFLCLQNASGFMQHFAKTDGLEWVQAACRRREMYVISVNFVHMQALHYPVPATALASEISALLVSISTQKHYGFRDEKTAQAHLGMWVGNLNRRDVQCFLGSEGSVDLLHGLFQAALSCKKSHLDTPLEAAILVLARCISVQPSVASSLAMSRKEHVHIIARWLQEAVKHNRQFLAHGALEMLQPLVTVEESIAPTDTNATMVSGTGGAASTPTDGTVTSVSGIQSLAGVPAETNATSVPGTGGAAATGASTHAVGIVGTAGQTNTRATTRVTDATRTKVPALDGLKDLLLETARLFAREPGIQSLVLVLLLRGGVQHDAFQQQLLCETFHASPKYAYNSVCRYLRVLMQHAPDKSAAFALRCGMKELARCFVVGPPSLLSKAIDLTLFANIATQSSEAAAQLRNKQLLQYNVRVVEGTMGASAPSEEAKCALRLLTAITSANADATALITFTGDLLRLARVNRELQHRNHEFSDFQTALDRLIMSMAAKKQSLHAAFLSGSALGAVASPNTEVGPQIDGIISRKRKESS